MSDYLSISTSHTLSGIELNIGPLAYGCWRFAGTSVRAATAKIETAVESGITLIDTADIYTDNWPDGFGASEALLGDVLRDRPSLRQEIILATKGGIIPGLPYNSSAKYIEEACNASLRRLKTEVIDLYQIHRPDLTVSFEETAGVLTKLKEAGKIRAVGVSNFTATQCTALQAFLPFPIVSHQPEFSCAHTAPIFDGVLDQCQANKMVALAWSPLAGGALVTGKSDTPELQTQVGRLIPVLDRLANANSVDRGAIALAFLAVHPARVIPIIGTQSIDRIKTSTEALSVKLTRRDWYDILEASLGKQMP